MQHLSHWQVDVILHPDVEQGFPVPTSLSAHSARSIATSSTAPKGGSLGDIWLHHTLLQAFQFGFIVICSAPLDTAD